MFCRLDKFDGPMLGGGGVYTGGAYIWDVNWGTYLGGVYAGGACIKGGILTRFYGMPLLVFLKHMKQQHATVVMMY